MKRIRSIIVDDEPDAISNLSLVLSEFCDGVDIAGVADNIDAAVQLIKKTAPDLVFLDVELKHGTGFDLLNHFSKIDFQVIFVTAYQEYALKAIKVGALDYLLKPIDLDELRKVIDKVRQVLIKKDEELKTESDRVKNQSNGRLVLHSVNGFNIIDIKNLLYCKADGNYLHFKCQDGKDHLVTRNMKDYETLLAEHDFLRIHHSYLVNLWAVKQFIKTDGMMVVLENGEKIPVSIRKKDDFLQRIETLNLL